MAERMSKTSAKVAKKAAAKRGGTSLHPVPPASPRARTRATSTSLRTTSSTKLS
jgi:hypothetical protein